MRFLIAKLANPIAEFGDSIHHHPNQYILQQTQINDSTETGSWSLPAQEEIEARRMLDSLGMSTANEGGFGDV